MAASAEPAVQPPPTGLKRRRIAVGSSEQYEETTDHIGAGAFGSVIRGRHRATGRPVAIKRLAGAAHGGGGPAALLREARFLEEASAGNPYVVGFEGVVRVPGTMDLRLVMELVGPTLHDVLRHHRPRGSPPLPEATVRAAIWQLLAGAEGMHAAGVVHRDIKPQNIIVGDGHRVLKLCDLGLAVSVSEPPPYDPVGTLWYKAPEVLLEKPDYGAPVDAWSLGCVMAELINGGEPLFQGFDEQGQLRVIFDVLGAPNYGTWPWFSSPAAFATVAVPDLDMQRHSLLREVFPETKLSKEGFEVLSGLLTCNPDKRLTAAAALKHPWFAKIDALELPKTEEVEWPLHKRRRLRVLCA